MNVAHPLVWKWLLFCSFLYCWAVGKSYQLYLSSMTMQLLGQCSKKKSGFISTFFPFWFVHVLLVATVFCLFVGARWDSCLHMHNFPALICQPIWLVNWKWVNVIGVVPSEIHLTTLHPGTSLINDWNFISLTLINEINFSWLSSLLWLFIACLFACFQLLRGISWIWIAITSLHNSFGSYCAQHMGCREGGNSRF